MAVSYIYKISNSDTCSNSTGYSAERSTSINITDDISLFSKGPVYVCVIGINAQKARSSPVKSVWTKGPLALNFSQVFSEVSENGSTVSVDINLDYPAHEDLVINLKSGGQAVAGSNYQSLPSKITIPKGSTTYRLSVTPLNDSVTQSELNLNISLSDSATSANVVAGEASQFKLWLMDVGASNK